jgi:putative (di)nucleoside polyphosphate hydrolase
MDRAARAKLAYRSGVGVMLVNGRGEVFVARRVDMDDEAWQMPQGGIDEGEKPRQTALRELAEEIGTNEVRIIAESEDWLSYDFPDELIGRAWGGRYRGQRQKWFLARFLGRDEDIDLDTEHPEFSHWKWLPLAELPGVIVPFKRGLYEALVAQFGPLLEAEIGA